jgi:hypothetical protein
MNSTQHNLSLAEAMLAELEDYLKSRSLFWPLERRPPPGTPAYTRLTIGGFFLTLDELEAQRDEMEASEQKRYSSLKEEFNSLQVERAVALETKTAREAGARLNLWRAYVQDIEASDSGEWGYRTEVRQRVMLARLMNLIRAHAEFDELRDAILGLDRRLRPRFDPGDFVWDEKLIPIYPRARFWFLYGQPKEKL